MPKIFLSYRREDSQDVTGRIYDRLTQAIPSQDIFRDIDSISPGTDFRKVLEEAVGRCDLVLVVIGPHWLSAADGQGRRRLDNAGDFVRIEVESALKRGIPVVPVTVSNAAVPQENELPEALRELSFRNGRNVRPDPDFHNDMDRLIRELGGFSPGASRQALPPAGRAAAEPAHASRRPLAVLSAVALLAVAGVLLWRFWDSPPAPDPQAAAAPAPVPETAELLRKSAEDDTKGSLGALRGALAIYYGDQEGLYPSDLEALTVNQKYMISLPEAKTHPFHPNSSEVGFGAGDSDDSGGWLYNNIVGDSNIGTIRVNCTHTDSKGTIWTAY